MDLRQGLEEKGASHEGEGDSPPLRAMKSGLKTVMDTIRHSFLNG